MKPLDIENDAVLNLVYVLVGVISPNFRRVSIVVDRDVITLHFLLEKENAADRVEIEELVGDYEALDLDASLKVIVTIDDRPYHLLRFPGRPVYGRREIELDD